MILKAVVAVAIGGKMLGRRSVAYRKKAAIYAEQEARALARARELETSAAHFQREAEDMSESGKGSRDRPQIQRNMETSTALDRERASIESRSAEFWREHAAGYARGKRKYERAAARPWESVEPDHPVSE
jgi:hypothetical protein